MSGLANNSQMTAVSQYLPPVHQSLFTFLQNNYDKITCYFFPKNKFIPDTY